MRTDSQRNGSYKQVAKFNFSWNRDYNNESSGITDNRFRQTETYLSATLWSEPVKGLSFSLAQDFAYNYLSTTLQNNQYPERFTYLTAIATHYKSNRFSATVSLLNTYITENVRTGKAAADRKRFSPAVSLSWKPFDFGLRFRASYKDIFRTPTFNDLYYLVIGNYNLKPEKTKTIEYRIYLEFCFILFCGPSKHICRFLLQSHEMTKL